MKFRIPVSGRLASLDPIKEAVFDAISEPGSALVTEEEFDSLLAEAKRTYAKFATDRGRLELEFDTETGEARVLERVRGTRANLVLVDEVQRGQV